MGVAIRIAGPGLDTVRELDPDGGELVLGRDLDCGACLPDPERNVSRKHLALWCEQDTVRFRVLSAVNGVQMADGEVGPGGEGVLAAGAALSLADYTVTVQEGAAAVDDPWAVLDREHSGTAPAEATAHTLAEQDPFGDWGFATTFGPGGAAGGLDAASLALPQDMAAFFRGLGLPPGAVLTQGELEGMGRMVRVALLGLMDLHSATREGQLGGEAPRSNPLLSDAPAMRKLQYLLAGRAAAGAFPHPERAMSELVRDLLAHQEASGAAARAVVEGTLREFDPATLKTTLLGGHRLFEAVRAWDAFNRHYAQQAQDVPAWVARLFERFFAPAYAEALARLQSETSDTRP